MFARSVTTLRTREASTYPKIRKQPSVFISQRIFARQYLAKNTITGSPVRICESWYIFLFDRESWHEEENMSK